MVAGKAARAASRLRGGGSALPGLVAERVDPGFLAHALADVPGGIVVVTGTNGKTTTTKMLVAVLRAHGRTVFTNPTGSNFTRGVISSMLGELPAARAPRADMAVLELDEAHALKFAAAVKPTHALLLNVARDQLDRFAEIDHTAKLLASLAEQTTTGWCSTSTTRSSRGSATASATGWRCTTSGSTPRSPTGCPSCRSRTCGSTTTSSRRSRGRTTGCSSRSDERTFEVASVRLTARSAGTRHASVRSSSSSAGSPP